MPIYRVMIEGRDFPGRMFDKHDKRFGFYATRWCEAENEEVAELAVVDALRDEFRGAVLPLRDGEPIPSLHLDEIEELQAFPKEHPGAGATWFPMDEDD